MTDPALARSVTDLVIAKYEVAIQRSSDGSLSPAEQATFELLPAADAP